MHTLLIIDMQPRFQAAKKISVIEKCKSEIKKAIRGNCSIIFLEWSGCGKTKISLLREVVGYKKAKRLIKRSNSGYEVLKNFYTDSELEIPSKFRVCGVNTDACVYETISEMAENSLFSETKFKIVKNGCNSFWKNEVGLEMINGLNQYLGRRFFLV